MLGCKYILNYKSVLRGCRKKIYAKTPLRAKHDYGMCMNVELVDRLFFTHD